ncbi:hypothetical protein SRHO_G00081480 [Serrasalmus rhombeus]
MEEEIQQLRDLVLQLKADNERLLQERAAVSTVSGVATPASPVAASNAPPAGVSTVTERLVSYVTLQQAFFSHNQQEGETLQEFSLALLALMEPVKQHAPEGLLNVGVLLRDQFVEHVLDGALRRELKQFVRQQPNATLLEVRGEAIRWEREGLPGGARGRSFSLPSAYGLQYSVQGGSRPAPLHASQPSELGELKDLLKQQQEQLNKLTSTVVALQTSSQSSYPFHRERVICRRCQQPGHFARECDGERVLPPSRALPQNVARPPRFSRQMEN